MLAVSRFAPFAWIATAFIGSRIYAHACGVRFEAGTLREFWHFIDPVLLESRMGESLWHLHGQPPLFSLWLGSYLKLFGPSLPQAFAVTYLLLGVLFAREIYVFSRRASLGPWSSSLLTSVIVAAPAFLLFESFLFYTYPEALLLLMSTNLALAAVRRPSTSGFFRLASALCTLALLRSMFHPAWVLALLGVVLFLVGRVHLGSLVKGAALPLLLVGLVMTKNALLYDTTSLSTWRGMNLSRVVIDRMPSKLRTAWVQKGILSPVASVGGFKPLAAYGTRIALPAATGIPLLDQASKSTGAINLHHLAYVSISKTLERDALTVIRRRPRIYLKSVLTNLATTFEPSSRYRALKEVARPLTRYAEVWQVLFGLSSPAGSGKSWAWMLLTPALLIWASVRLWQRRTFRDTGFVAMGLCVMHISYVIVLGALLERSENQRFRFDVDPFIFVLLLLALRELFAALVPERRRRGSEGTVSGRG